MIMRYLYLLFSLFVVFTFHGGLNAQEAAKPAASKQPRAIHPEIGNSVSSYDGQFSITLLTKKQYYSRSDTMTMDPDVRSPKSVHIHPSGEKYYVNSLEGMRTVVYESATNTKKKVINHTFNKADTMLWSKPSGLYPFTHYKKNLNTFSGKPVESAFSHDGRYLWVPYYRRSYDINAQDPSAVAVIDTETDSIVKLMETGPLPKMIAVSHNNNYVAITHWGDNTVGIVDISSDSPADWHHVACVTVKYKLTLNFSMTTPVNRDVNSGMCLRGTAFTPDDRYLLVGAMGGSGGINVIDMEDFTYKGTVSGMMSNLRHLVIRNQYIYLSINKSGYIQRAPLEAFMDTVANMKNGKARFDNWTNCKVGSGARTIEVTSDGRYVIAACNSSNCLTVVDAETMKPVATIPADSYPVGLDISKDCRFVYLTSQAREGMGGNCVDIFKLKY